MPDIGETLRETRMRRRIDMAEVEEATKIRAKYLRALENEEWGLLPGTTYVKTFLRTYADYLELDSRRLVEEYKLRYEGPRAGEPAPFGGLAGRRPQRRSRRRRSAGSFGPAAVVLGMAALLVVALYALGQFGSQDNAPVTPQKPRARSSSPTPSPTPTHHRAGARRPRHVKLVLEATGAVYVCLVDGSGRRLLDGQTLTTGQRSRRFTAKVLRMNLGTNNVRLHVNGKTYTVAPSANPVGYELRPGRRPRRLPDNQRPACT
jgi:transcriptional regulator with XRE-family HTH domain